MRFGIDNQNVTRPESEEEDPSAAAAPGRPEAACITVNVRLEFQGGRRERDSRSL